MTLPSFAPGVAMGADMILGELTETGQFSIDATNERSLAERTTGQISFYDFYGKTDVRPGCVDITTSQQIKIPKFRQQLVVQVWGGGGGGAVRFDYAPTNGLGGPGNNSVFYGPDTMIAYGGSPGFQQSPSWGTRLGGYPGAGGSASGGQGNFRGAGGQGNNGGNAPNGGLGGVGGQQYWGIHGPQNGTQIWAGTNGGFPGAGGGGEASIGGPTPGDNVGGGGAAGYCYRTYLPGQITPGTMVNCVVGGGGQSSFAQGGNGGNGLIKICIDTPVALPQETMYWDGNPYMNVASNQGGSGWQAANPIDAGSYNWPYVAWIYQYDVPDPVPGGTDTPPGTSCFLIDSIVRMADGTDKLIQHVQIGDLLMGAKGSANPVLALNRPLLNNRMMAVINDEHTTTLDHAHVKSDYTFGAVSLSEYVNGENNTVQDVIVADGSVEHWLLPGFADADMDLISQIDVGNDLITVDGIRKVQSVAMVKLPADTQLYNFVVGGDHTYFVSDYCVTGFLNGIDYDYRTWQPVGKPWTADDYRRTKL